MLQQGPPVGLQSTTCPLVYNTTNLFDIYWGLQDHSATKWGEQTRLKCGLIPSLESARTFSCYTTTCISDFHLWALTVGPKKCSHTKLEIYNKWVAELTHLSLQQLSQAKATKMAVGNIRRNRITCISGSSTAKVSATFFLQHPYGSSERLLIFCNFLSFSCVPVWGGLIHVMYKLYTPEIKRVWP